MKYLILILTIILSTTMVFAESIGEVKTKGLFIKDSLEVVVFDDPTIKGVSCYTTVHKRTLSFESSSSVSLSCRQTGVISGKLVNMSNVFSRSKSLFFKKTVVDRFYDAKRNVIIYLTYTKDTGGKNSSNSISVVVVRK